MTKLWAAVYSAARNVVVFGRDSFCYKRVSKHRIKKLKNEHIETVAKTVDSLGAESLADIAASGKALDSLEQRNPLYSVINSNTGLVFYATQDWKSAVSFFTGIFSLCAMQSASLTGKAKVSLIDLADISLVCLYDPQPGKNDISAFIKTENVKLPGIGRVLTRGMFDVESAPHEKNSFCVGVMLAGGSASVEESYGEISEGLYMRLGHTEDADSVKFTKAFGLNVEFAFETQAAIADNHGSPDLYEILSGNIKNLTSNAFNEPFKGWQSSEPLKTIGESFSSVKSDDVAMKEIEDAVMSKISGVRS